MSGRGIGNSLGEEPALCKRRDVVRVRQRQAGQATRATVAVLAAVRSALLVCAIARCMEVVGEGRTTELLQTETEKKQGGESPVYDEAIEVTIGLFSQVTKGERLAMVQAYSSKRKQQKADNL